MNKAQVKAVLSFQSRTVDQNPFHLALHKAWVGKNGMQFITDNYKVICFREHIDGLLQYDDNCPKEWKEKYETVEAIFEDALANSNDYMRDVTATEIREYIKSPDAPKTDMDTLIWKFGVGLPWVDANFLLDILRIVPDARFARPNDVHSPIFFSGKNGEGILFPLRQYGSAY